MGWEKPHPARWLLRPAIPPNRIKLPERQIDRRLGSSSSGNRRGWFHLYNPYSEGYLGDARTFHTYRNYKTYEGGAPGVGSASGAQFHNEQGPDAVRYFLRSPADMETVFGPNGKPDAVKEQNQKNQFCAQCWYIEDRSPEPPQKAFKQLDKDYISNWIDANEQAMKKSAD